MSRCRRWVGCLASGMLGLAIWTVIIEPRWVAAREMPLQIADWQGPAGLKVVVASDWHLTENSLWRVTTVDRARRIVQAINAAQPDVILLPGDFIAAPLAELAESALSEREVAQVLGGLKARLGVFAVLGNHDWVNDGATMVTELRQVGIHVLQNDATPLGRSALWVVGVGDHSTGHSKPAAAMRQVPVGAQVLALMHDPASLTALPSVQGLVVAGHTHGGQVYLPGYGALITRSAAPRQWAYGWVTHGTNRMYVTSGIGVSILPVRFNMRPEWVMFTVNGVENSSK